MPYARGCSRATRSTSSPLRATKATAAPRPSTSRTSASPRPVVPPVMATRRPWRSCVDSASSRGSMCGLLSSPCRGKIAPRLPSIDWNVDGLSEYQTMGAEGLSDRIARSLRTLRDARGLTQEQVARLAGVPRATWANLEAGGGNPTLAVLHRVAQALQVPLDELIAEPRAACRFYPRDQLTEKRRGDVRLRNLLPDPLPGVVLDRMELPPRSQLTGVPHMPGTREYLACEAGTIVLAAAGERWTLRAGDVVVFRGDQRHSYANPGAAIAVGYSVVLLVPVS